MPRFAARAGALRTGSVRRFLFVLAVLPLALLFSCGTEGSQETEDYGNLLASPGGLVVLEEEHPTGWGRADCLVCHEPRNMHAVNRTGLPDCASLAVPEACVDLREIRALVLREGEASCGACHGSNGVEP